MSLDQWSQTPASNDLANYFQTGMAPSKVKNAGWDLMADACAVISNGSMPTSGGTANAQTITNARTYGALFTGMWAVFVPSATNTAAMTLQVDGLAAKNVFCNGAAALAGQVIIGIPAMCRYDGTQWQLLNPQRATLSFTGQLTGVSSGGSGTVNAAIQSDSKTVHVWFASALTGPSNTTACTMTGVPALIQPATTSKQLAICVQNSSAISNGTVLIAAASGTWTLGNPGTGAFTASNNKGFSAGDNFNYVLDN